MPGGAPGFWVVLASHGSGGGEELNEPCLGPRSPGSREAERELTGPHRLWRRPWASPLPLWSPGLLPYRAGCEQSRASPRSLKTPRTSDHLTFVCLVFPNMWLSVCLDLFISLCTKFYYKVDLIVLSSLGLYVFFLGGGRYGIVSKQVASLAALH